MGCSRIELSSPALRGTPAVCDPAGDNITRPVRWGFLHPPKWTTVLLKENDNKPFRLFYERLSWEYSQWSNSNPTAILVRRLIMSTCLLQFANLFSTGVGILHRILVKNVRRLSKVLKNYKCVKWSLLYLTLCSIATGVVSNNRPTDWQRLIYMPGRAMILT